MNLKIENDRVATLNFVLKDDDGDIIDASEADAPLVYLHGHENIVPGLEAALLGKVAGDRVQVVVEPQDGYGETTTDELIALPRDAFEGDVEVGDLVELEDDDGDLIPVWVAEVDDDAIHVDVDHPLAGMRLHFDVEVLAVRSATEDEIGHGHPHFDDDDEE
ncbi:MAG: peptidylprolyl isomerase [Deltaproteobacteria bacterium]|nr:MAG: peptidylprolyl isomerase [Deltaproteobacteria bacterium]